MPADDSPRVFVYGSLKPGRERWSSLAPFVGPGVSAVDASVRGQLWRTPWGWPALTDGTREVPGMVVTLDDAHVDTALHVLDEIEGTARGLFERVEAETLSGIVCWTYRWPGSTDGFDAIDGPW